MWNTLQEWLEEIGETSKIFKLMPGHKTQRKWWKGKNMFLEKADLKIWHLSSSFHLDKLGLRAHEKTWLLTHASACEVLM
jgi:hypothetical protein